MMPKPFLIKSQRWIWARCNTRRAEGAIWEKRPCYIVYRSPPVPPSSSSITCRNMSADALTACLLFMNICSLWCVFRQKRHARPVTPHSEMCHFFAFRNDKDEFKNHCRPICFLPSLPDEFIWCCHKAKFQINKAISASQPLTLSRKELLGVTGATAHGVLIISVWLSGYWEAHRSVCLTPLQGMATD